jgi:hypothetical protein
MEENQGPFQKHLQEKADKLKWEIEFRKKAQEEINNNPDIQDYFKQFNPESVNSFVDLYLTYKTGWHDWGKFYLEQKEKSDLQWVEQAHKHLGIIQQKKLFDLQCLWRAEQITIPGVELIFDLLIWEGDIFNCPLIDPITQEEVEWYQEYLETEMIHLDDEPSNVFLNWQSYEEIKIAYDSPEEAGINFPMWYDFHNRRKGTELYIELPDIRGEKEQHYRQLALSLEPDRAKGYREVMQAFKADPHEHIIDKEGRRHLNYYLDAEEFVDLFEDKLTQEYFEAYTWFNENRQEEEDLQEMIVMLLASGEQLPIEANEDWREALKETAMRYRIRRVAEAMPEAFEQYRLNITMGIAFPAREHNMMHVRDTIVKDILTGRRLCGEPEDLNF